LKILDPRLAPMRPLPFEQPLSAQMKAVPHNQIPPLDQAVLPAQGKAAALPILLVALIG